MLNNLYIAQIVLSVALSLVVLFQTKGGGLGGIFGQQSSVYRTRRGVEKILFQLTIAFVAIFITISVVALRLST